ncbi:DNA repair protein RecO [Pseudoalteromonas denitrificans]|uniref:DNA repair protein RecO n=1 Tax=Pseudoalteromonas denitrificans DSM 6059 TaxID=1123010 RepID=A0A1I1HK73_9GAMM|nr:DNA repair protein RecO [Pseudoalteromonas denitrificans]SFC21490.1 DNA replication and repair protein RecO [Pseudoalteromonas denitrificans DSM 6059]
MNNQLYQAYLLHKRPFSDSQAMLDILVDGVGQIRMLARLSGKHSVKHKAQLQPFQKLLISFSGNKDLKYLNQFELAGPLNLLSGRALYCGFYLNELCQRIVPHNEPIEQVFVLYNKHLMLLPQSDDYEANLRTFEFQLLELLGYGIDFEFDVEGDKIQEKSFYQYHDEMGWLKLSRQEINEYAVNGKQLQNIHQFNFIDSATRNLAKQLSRYLLKPLLGNKPLKSRELFIKP